MQYCFVASVTFRNCCSQLLFINLFFFSTTSGSRGNVLVWAGASDCTRYNNDLAMSAASRTRLSAMPVWLALAGLLAAANAIDTGRNGIIQLHSVRVECVPQSMLYYVEMH